MLSTLCITGKKTKTFLKTHDFTYVRISLYVRMHRPAHTYTWLPADVRVKSCYLTWLSRLIQKRRGDTKKTIFSDSLFCDRDRIQTCNRLIRSQLLYSVELRGHCKTNQTSFGSDRDRIQTCNRLIRSQLLYSVELRGHCKTNQTSFGSDRDRIQTCNRLIRSQLLYSVELRGHCLLFFRFNGCKDTDFF